MGRKKVECQCDPPCVSAAACRQKWSRAARRATAIALAVGAVGVALVGAAAVVAGAAALAAGSRLQTPVKRPAPPTQMAPPRKATKQRSLFETLQSPEPQAPPTVKVQDVASAVLWFRGHSAFEGDALACPNLYGAHKHFGLAKKRYFDLPQADRSQMNGVDAFMTFWQALVAAESLPMSLRLYGAVVLLASPSSCDAERAISTLNRIVTPLRNRMSWPMVRLHLIGAEDVDPDGYPYELVAQSWDTTAHRRRRSSQNVRKPRKDKGKERTRERVLPETAEYVDNLTGFRFRQLPVLFWKHFHRCLQRKRPHCQ